jgi:hypothetical protein
MSGIGTGSEILFSIYSLQVKPTNSAGKDCLNRRYAQIKQIKSQILADYTALQISFSSTLVIQEEKFGRQPTTLHWNDKGER